MVGDKWRNFANLTCSACSKLLSQNRVLQKNVNESFMVKCALKAFLKWLLPTRIKFLMSAMQLKPYIFETTELFRATSCLKLALASCMQLT